jgi:hypothetical protein
MDDAVRLVDFGDCLCRSVDLGIDDHDLAAGLFHPKWLPLHREKRLAIHQMGGTQLSRHDMIGEDLGDSGPVFGPSQGGDGTLRQLAESALVGAKTV